MDNKKLLQQVMDAYPEFNIKEFNFYDKKNISTLSLPNENSLANMEALKTWQRLIRIHDDPDAVNSMQANGYTSAMKIAATPRSRFIEDMAPQLGENGEQLAGTIHARAQGIKGQVFQLLAAVHNTSAPYAKALKANNISAGVSEYFAGLPSYQDIFGSLNYADTEHTMTLFSPAAYFVDLMRIEQDYIQVPNQATIPDSMKLENRRPDLFSLPLTMADMEETVPYIKIAIERMEAFLAQIAGEDKNLYKSLAKRLYPFHLPVQLPLERMRLYLQTMKLQLQDIYLAMNAKEVPVAAEELSLSAEAWDLITKADASEAGLKKCYGVTDLTNLSDVQFFCRQAGVNEKELREIIYQNLSESELEAKLQSRFFVNQGVAEPLAIHDGTEGLKLESLDNGALDRLNRFIRLAAGIGWTYTELDWALGCVREDTVAINENTLTALAEIKRMTRQLDIPVDLACSLSYDLKTYGRDSIFDAIINPAGVTPYHPRYDGNSTFQDPVWQWNIMSKEAADVAIAARIASSIGLSQPDTILLAGMLFKTETPLEVTVGHLSTLYAHAKIMSRAGLTAEQYKILYTLPASQESQPAVKSALTDMRSIEDRLETVRLLNGIGLNIYELDYIIRQTERKDISILYKEPEAKKWRAALPSLTQSSLTAPEEQREEKYNKLLIQLGSLLGISKDQVSSMLYLSAEPDIFHIFLEESSEAKALSLLRSFSQRLMLIIKLKLTPAEAKSIETHAADYGISSLQSLALNDVLNMIRFRNLQNAYGDVYGSAIAYMDAQDNEAAITAVNQLTGIEKARITLVFNLYPEAGKLEKLIKLQGVDELRKISGVDIQFLDQVTRLAGCDAEHDWDSYVQMADNLYAALAAGNSPESWTTVSRQLMGKEYEIKRNALIPTAVCECGKQEDLGWIKKAHNLYEYLLIDVEMGGEQQISYLKEAINSLQLYLRRCREQMEPGVVKLPIPGIWWEWISNYRFWEANRKVFLYPENYIDPAQRASKTKLFSDMEDSLKQDSIKTDTVEAAFRKYLEGFAELAQLIYVDCYYCNISDDTRDDAPTLFLFARTQTQPYKYYYIVQEYDGAWSDWNEINISINADSISPVYALQRLFVFWVEISDHESASTDTKTADNKSKTKKAAIRYSFYNFSGDWVQPQTLVADAVISPADADHIPSYNGLFTKDMFDATDPQWTKVYPLRIEPSGYWSLENGANQYEKIVLFYGPVLNTEHFPTWTAPADVKKPDVKDTFLTLLYNCYTSFAYLKERNALGSLPVFAAIVLNDDLECGFLANPDECVFLSKDSGLGAGHYRPVLNRSSGAFGYISSLQVIQDNYNQAQIISPIRLDPKQAIILSSSMRDKSYHVLPVKNNPAALMFSGGKESFLLWDHIHGQEPMNANVYNSDTLFKADSFIASEVGLNETASRNIFKQLTDFGYFNEYGLLDRTTDYKSLVKDIREIMTGEARESDKAAVVKNMVMHQPVLKSDSFVDDAVGINLTGSQNVFKQLVANGYLDPTGCLDADVDFYDLTNQLLQILDGETKLEEKVSSIVDRMFQYSYPSGLGCFAQKGGNSTEPIKFQAVRMTTAAVHKLSAALFTGGIERLLSLSSQQIPAEGELPFSRFQFNKDYVDAPAVTEGAQVDFDGVYGLYYWELFFHAPLYIASLLKTNQNFSEAEKWMEYIFNPFVREEFLTVDSLLTSTIGKREARDVYTILTDQNIITAEGRVSASFSKDTDLGVYLKSMLNEEQIVSVQSILLNYQLSTPYARLWQFQPFRNRTLESLLKQLGNPKEIAAYNADPFDPHAIARLRPGAYEKTMVMKYIDNLLNWGDYFFTQYTWESLTAATMLYISAYNLLGDRPLLTGGAGEQKPITFSEIYAKYQGDIPQFLIDMEHIAGGRLAAATDTPINATDLYFTIPENQDFIAYWDKVENRLYNIRHGLNIDGQSQFLSLYEYPLDPAMLSKLRASGGDILELMQAGTADASNYRFPVLLERAKTMIQSVIQLGNTLLSVLEKKDAEGLAALRAVQERNILNLTTLSKEKQIKEAEYMIDSLNENLKNAQYKKSHYEGLYNEDLNALETASVDLMGTALLPQTIAIGIRGVAVASYLLPNIFGLADGGMQFGDAVNMGAAIADGTAGMLTHTANMIATIAQYQRRREEWALSRQISAYEIEQINQQIASSQARVDYLKQDLKIHHQSIEQAKEYDDYLQGKFTNEELYQWMVGRVSTLYFQTYRMAMGISLAAQNAYQNEMAANDSFIEFQYWDSLRKGLLAGESLMLSVNQMEKSYLDQNTRSLEIEKTLSLLHLDPRSFLEFKQGVGGKEKGTLSFELSEKLFDFDFPGHYQRRIKSISVTIPAVVGPYQNINATLVQNKSTIILKNDMAAVRYADNPVQYPDYPAGSIKENWRADQQIAISKAMDDSGMFVLDFKSDQYLPFEGTGAVSKWTLTLPPETNRIDFAGISDIIITVKYTAKDGGSDFAAQVRDFLRAEQPPYPYKLAKYIDLKQAFALEWNTGIGTSPVQGLQKFCFQVTDKIVLPNLSDMQLEAATIVLNTADGKTVRGEEFLYLRTSDTDRLPVAVSDNVGSALLQGAVPVKAAWTLEFDTAQAPSDLLKNNALNPEVLQDIAVLIQYESNVFKKNGR